LIDPTAGQPGLVGQDRTLLKRPIGRPPHEVRRFFANFSYQAQSWNKPRRVVAKVEWHPGKLYPRVGFIVTNLARAAERVVAFYNQCGTAEQWIKEGKDAIKMDAAVMPQQSRNASTPRRNQSAGSTAFHGPSGRSYLAEDAGRGNHDLATAVEIWAVEIRAWHPGNVGQDHPAQALAHLVRHATSPALASVRGTVSLGAGMATLPMNSIEL
jgi:hypothetical protein